MKAYMNSPQYDEASNSFQHPAGYRNDKGLFDVLGLAGAFFTREDDRRSATGFRFWTRRRNLKVRMAPM